MTRSFRRAAILLAAALDSGAPPAAATEPSFLGETLRFAMTILGIPAGELILSAEEDRLEGRSAFHFQLWVASNKTVSKFFPIRDCLASWADPATFRTLRLEKHTRELGRAHDEVLDFDWNEGMAFGEAAAIPIEDFVLDALSSIYYMRTRDLTPGDVIVLPIVTTREHHWLRITVRGRETVSTPAGTFATLRVEPRITGGGLIAGGKNLVIWLTDDSRKMPVKLKSRLKIGSAVGLLRSVEEPRGRAPLTPER